jgi:DNA-binding SARP family transcriptional activator
MAVIEAALVTTAPMRAGFTKAAPVKAAPARTAPVKEPPAPRTHDRDSGGGSGPSFGILGLLDVRAGGRPLDIGSPKQRLVLALLLCEANTPVAAERLIAALWPREQPRNARKSVQVYISNLRGALHREEDVSRIHLDNAGYRIDVRPHELDFTRFGRLARDGAEQIRAGAPAAGAALLKQALDLWRGPALREFDHVDAVRGAVDRMTRARLTLFENWVEAELALGNAVAVADALADVALQHPTRERLRALQITALCRTDRLAEAAAVHDEVRQTLARDFGLDPGPAIRKAYREELLSTAGGPSGPRRRTAPQPPRVRAPHDPDELVGRGEEIRRVLAGLADGAPRRVVLTGQVGVGKTALALHAAHLLRPGFADGSVLIRLRGQDGSRRSLASVLTELWLVAQVPGDLPPDPDAAVAVWQGHAARRRILLILDDARDEALVRRLTPQGASSAALVTSRSKLAGLSSACRVEVPPLAAQPAARMLERIVGADRARREPGAALRIALATGRLPLGIRVAGDRLASLRHVPLAQFADRVEGPRRLDHLYAGDTSVRSRIDEAFGDLPDGVLRGLRSLGALPFAPFGVREAAAALGTGQVAAGELLDILIEHSVVSAAGADGLPQAARFDLPILTHARLREERAQEAGAADGAVPAV